MSGDNTVMASPSKEDLLRAVIASPHWRLMERMRLIDKFGRAWTVLLVSGGYVQGWNHDEHYLGDMPTGALPDFDDSATRGRLLELVRIACGDSLLRLVPCRPHALRGRAADYWVARVSGRWEDEPRGETEADALVAAFLAAGGAK